MQDWSKDDSKPGRPAVAFGRRPAPGAPPYPSSPHPAPPQPAPAPAVSPQPHPQPAPPRVPLSTIPQAHTLPKAPPLTSGLPISSQQLQLFQGPMGTTRGSDT